MDSASHWPFALPSTLKFSPLPIPFFWWLLVPFWALLVQPGETTAEFYHRRRGVDKRNLGGFSGPNINPLTGALQLDGQDPSVCEKQWREYLARERKGAG